MKLTILLTIGMMVLLFLMIWSATATLPYKGLAKNLPVDVQEMLKPRLDYLPMSRKRILGWIILILLLLMMIGILIYAGIDGIRRNYSFGQFLLRFLIMLLGNKAFDIIGLDFFLLTKTHFFQHYLPETEGCAGWKNFGYNRKEQAKQCIMIPIFCLIMAGVFTWIG